MWISVKDRLPNNGDTVLLIEHGFLKNYVYTYRVTFDEHGYLDLRFCSNNGDIESVPFREMSWLLVPSPEEGGE